MGPVVYHTVQSVYGCDYSTVEWMRVVRTVIASASAFASGVEYCFLVSPLLDHLRPACTLLAHTTRGLAHRTALRAKLRDWTLIVSCRYRNTMTLLGTKKFTSERYAGAMTTA